MSLMFGVDSNNDLYLDRFGNVALVRDLQATLEACEHAIKTVSAECIFDQPRGLPYFEAVWSGSPNIQQYNFSATNALLAVDNVVSVPDFQSDIAGNTFGYVAVIETTFGIGTITR